MIIPLATLLIAACVGLWFWTRSSRSSILVVLGSGGHSAEMIFMMKQVNFALYDKVFVVYSNSDSLSKTKFLNFLEENNKTFEKSKVEFISIPRTNEVGEKALKSVVKTLFAMAVTLLKVLTLERCTAAFFNGPGVCIPVILSLWAKNVG